LVVYFSGTTAPAAAPVFVSASSAATATAAQTLAIARPAGAGAGHVLVAVVAARINSVNSISAPSGWTTAKQTTCSSSTNAVTQATFVRVASAVEPDLYTFTATASTGAVGTIAAYAGIDGAQPIVAAAGRVGTNSRSMIAPSINVSVAGALLVAAWANNGRTAITPPTGMLVRGNTITGSAAPSAHVVVADQVLTAAGNTGNRTANAADRNACNVGQQVALRPSAAVPPSNTAPPVISGQASEGALLSSTTGSWSGSPTSYAYRWQRSSGAQTWADVPAATAASYTLTAADVGFALRVVVTASNTAGSASATSAATTTVLPAPPASLSAPLVSGTARELETLSASNGTWSGSPTGYAYQWQRSGGAQIWTDVPAASSASYTLAAADVGHAVRVVVTASNTSGSASAASAATATVLPVPPTSLSPPLVSGTARELETLSATTGSWSGSPTGYAYEWHRCDEAGACGTIPGASNPSYTLAATDVGFAVRVVVTASNAGGSTSALSGLTPIVVAQPPPANLAPPTVVGEAREGGILTALAGTWSGSPTAYAYRWQRSDDGASWGDIAGALTSSYTPGGGDVGLALRVVVTASNGGGSTSAFSQPTAAVEPAPAPTAIDPPTISGLAREGDQLTATTGTWAGAPTSYAFEWQQSADGQSWAPIDGADGSTYVPTAADRGLLLRVTVAATNGAGTATAVSTPTDAVLPAAPVTSSPPVVLGQTLEGETLTASAGQWLGDPTSFDFQWERCNQAGAGCAPIASASADEYTLATGDVGKTIRVAVTASNQGGATVARSGTTTVVTPLPPVNVSAPTVGGTAQQGSVLTAATGSWSGGGTLSYGYQWQRSADGGGTWAGIPGALAASYAVGSGDVGLLLRVVVTASNEGGWASAASAATAVVIAQAGPSNVTLPWMSGYTQAGRTLTAGAGTWTDSPTAYAYRWERSLDSGATWAAIAGATASTYLLTSADVGFAVRLAVTAFSAIGQTTATSSPADIYPSGNLVVMLNTSWSCRSAVNLDLVKVVTDRGDPAVTLAAGCTGRIARLEVTTSYEDAIKVGGATDVVVASGRVTCTGRVSTGHQDGVQAQSGTRVTFQELVIDCRTANSAALFISRASTSVPTPTDVVCERCTILGANSTVNLKTSLRSGVRDSRICPSIPYPGLTFRIDASAVDPIDVGNTTLSGSDPICQGAVP
jgi:hypothetical protein